jgi:hypothetical protein
VCDMWMQILFQRGCLFLFFFSVASRALFVKAWETRKKRGCVLRTRVWLATSYVEFKDSKTPFLGWWDKSSLSEWRRWRSGESSWKCLGFRVLGRGK